MDIESVGLFAVALAGGLSLIAALAAWLRTSPPKPILEAAVTLIIPLTGGGVDVRRLLAAMARQSLPPHRMVFTVESVDDPAHRLLRNELAATGLAADVIVAGAAAGSTQKCHNLARALAEAEDGESIVVLADADILPQSGWLADLVRPIAHGNADVVSGYRWALPSDTRTGTLLCAWIDRAIASIPKMPWQHLAWAGSLALTARARERLDIATLLETGISDDLGIARAAAERGIPIVYRMRVLVPSPVSHSLSSFFGFATRQYQMLKLFQPIIWTSALLTVSASLVVRGGLWGAAALSSFWLQVLGAFIAANLAAYGLRLLRARYLGCLRASSATAELSLLILPLLGPVIDAVHLLAILRGGRARRIDWAHLTYEVEGARVVSIRRQASW